MLTGAQIGVPGQDLLRLGNRPERRVKLSSIDLPQSNGQKWAWTVGAAVDWTTQAASLSAPTIAVVDSGIDASRADFGSRLLDQVDLASLSPNSPGDGYGHGTFVAGVAAGQASGFAGVAPSANLVSLDVMDDEGEATVADIVAACDWILQNKDAVQHPRRQLLAARGGPGEPVLRSARPGGREALAERRRRRHRGRQLRRQRCGERRPFAPGNDPFVITVGASDVQNTVRDRATTRRRRGRPGATRPTAS